MSYCPSYCRVTVAFVSTPARVRSIVELGTWRAYTKPGPSSMGARPGRECCGRVVRGVQEIPRNFYARVTTRLNDKIAANASNAGKAVAQ